MTPACHPSWTTKALRAVLRDMLPPHDHAAALADAPAAMRAVPMLDAADARQARIDRMGQRLKHLVQVADAPADAAVSA